MRDETNEAVELKAAVERLTRLANGEQPLAVYPVETFNPFSETEEIVFDALAHARDLKAVLALPADGEGEPCRECEAVSAAIGSVEFMDPPDGGDVSLSKQVQRMRGALVMARGARDHLREDLYAALPRPADGGDREKVARTARVGPDAANPNNRRLFVDGQQWAKVYGWDKASVEARSAALIEALTSPTERDVAGLRELLEEARDLLMERRHGNNARSPGHNARLVIEHALTTLAPTTGGDDGR